MSYTPLRSGHTLDLLFPVTDNARCGVGVVAKILSIKHEMSAASALKKRGTVVPLNTAPLPIPPLFRQSQDRQY